MKGCAEVRKKEGRVLRGGDTEGREGRDQKSQRELRVDGGRKEKIITFWRLASHKML
jgi:hypothetical protein